MHVLSSHNITNTHLDKRVKAVYVDEVPIITNLQELGEDVEVTTCNSLSDAFELMSNQYFDIAFCSMIAPPKLLKEFFLKFSKMLPIIAISSSDDPLN